MIHYCDGAITQSPLVPATDRGYRHGLGITETLVARPEVRARGLHRARWRHGLDVLGWKDDGQFDAAIDALLEAHPGPTILRVQAAAADADCRITGTARPWVATFRGPVSVATTSVVVPRQPWSGIKPTSFMPWVMARREAEARGADEGLLTDGQGVVEGSISNIFAVVDGRTCAPGPDAGAVDGVTRRLVLDAMQLEVESTLRVADLARVSEAFLTNTTSGVVPICQLDGRRLPIGPVTQQCQAAYEAL